MSQERRPQPEHVCTDESESDDTVAGVQEPVDELPGERRRDLSNSHRFDDDEHREELGPKETAGEDW